ncbi:copper chaperone [Ectothiorhodosinus mongolicus]|uniref:Copper chaperone n=1 Tax=Ectothiorhodosinus mongolicus TaxID=233100 RepID=A0A1R3VM23_9GAMM|nr:heavy metal-associated domain-containing protein [Ectothiorhodosinus mongolicus]ULX57777.1 heavy metal transporter [Ectothiorhodosinus mongolicus]SIT65640.1 copper chaperone [Ectothiorhodosinus mongolicus]
MRIEVENIKCGGCAASIRKGLLSVPGVSDVEVNVDEGWVELTGAETVRPDAVAKLLSMGYPETGSVHGLKAAGSKAKSFVSCAIGRMQQD